MPKEPRYAEEILRCLKHKRCMLYGDLVKCASDALVLSPATVDNYLRELVKSGRLVVIQLHRDMRVVCGRGFYSFNTFLKSIEGRVQQCISSKSFKVKDVCQCLFQTSKCNSTYFYQTYFMLLGILNQLIKAGAIRGYKVYQTSKGLRVWLI